jgi:plastocyanin
MKSKFTAIAAMMILLIWSCTENDDSNTEIFFDPDVSTNSTNLGETVTFTDYSTGVRSRTWTFPGGTPITSTEKEVEVQFSEVGLINCTIENTFIDGITQTKDVFIQVGSGLIDYDVSAIKVNAGESITFTDNSNSVTSRTWTFPGGSPATSNDAEVEVTFNQEGPVTCTLEVTFLNGVVDVQEIEIQIGNEQYPRPVFGFEDIELAAEVWGAWISNGTNDMVFSIENEVGMGANETDGFAKIEINAGGVESQLYTKGVEGYPNAVLESFKTYEFSFWIKSDDFNSITAAEVSNESEFQTWNNFAWYSPIPEVGAEWSFKTITFQTGDLAQMYSEGTANNVWTQFKFIQSGTGIIYIDEISLKEIE